MTLNPVNFECKVLGTVEEQTERRSSQLSRTSSIHHGNGSDISRCTRHSGSHARASTDADSLFSPSTHGSYLSPSGPGAPHETATIGPSYLSQTSIADSCYSSFPYSVSRASTQAPMLSQLPSPALVGSAPLQQPTPPQYQRAWPSMPPPPPPAQVDDKDQAKTDAALAPASPGTTAATAAQKAKKKHVCTTCSRPFSTSGHLARHTR
ncbi:hypothetical protein FRC06_008857 [Ceratobasidium sp. 370]|nr:hypothetical protein FRC06_008857 [Ceratobasidium sp. 370]